MEDFTGGVLEEYKLNYAPADLFTIMLKAFQRESMMGASVQVKYYHQVLNNEFS